MQSSEFVFQKIGEKQKRKTSVLSCSFTQMKTLHLLFPATTLFPPEFLHRTRSFVPPGARERELNAFKRNPLQILRIF